ncbi:MAG TPA: hypothetical protein VFS20_14085, partial [Longimicrobium sp.]|nr:hypothetical protein [Longimicrobium sp.]
KGGPAMESRAASVSLSDTAAGDDTTLQRIVRDEARLKNLTQSQQSHQNNQAVSANSDDSA